jgi:glycosyltransferase involved in cell wall biosynthesis
VVRRAVLAADALWFHSPEERELLVSAHPQAEHVPSRCGVVGVDPPPDLDAHAFATRRGLTGPYLFYGGRAAGGKGLDTLLAGAAALRQRIPNAGLVLSGEAAGGTHLPWVHSVGRLDERERWEATAGAAAVVVPGSLESLSLLALEAWAVSRPCLLNEASPVLRGHLLRSGGGFTFTDAEELASRAAQLIEHPGQAAVMGAAGRSYVQATYSWDLAEQRLRGLITATGQ